MATYGKLRQTNISGQAGTTWYVQLWKKDYTGSSTDMTLEGEGFNVKWSGQGGTRDRQFINSECVLNMFAQNDTDESLIYDIFSKGDRNYYVRIYKNSLASANIWWFGWVNPSFSKIENAPFPYTVNIKATDSIGTFSKRKEDSLDNLNVLSIPRVNSHIQDFGEIMGVNDNQTNIVSEGTFPDPSPIWDTQPAWTIPNGGGQIDYNGTSDRYIRQVLSSSIVAGNDYTISFTILNLAEGDTALLSLRVYNGLAFFDTSNLTYTSNGNYQVSGTLATSSGGFRIIGLNNGGSYSLTDVSVIDGLISNPSPCPTNNNWFQTSIDWWREGDTYQSDDPFYKYRATKTAFRENPIEEPTKYKEYDVLKGVLQTFNTVGVLSEGKYNFIQPNSWRNNTNGILPFYKYANGDIQNTSYESVDNLLRVNGTDATILSGSTITFEPPFKDVTAEFKGTLDVVSIPTDQSANTELQLGYLDANTGALKFKIDAVHTNKMLATSVEAELGVDPYGNDYEFRNCFIWLVNVALIKLTNGTDTYYLDTFSSNTSQEGEWSTSNYGNTINSGWAQWGAETGGTSTAFPDATYPCSISKVGSYYETVVSYLDTVYVNSPPPISGDLSITLTSTVYYYKVRNSWNPNSNTLNDAYPFTAPSIVSQSDVLNSSSYVRSIVNDDVTSVDGVLYTASQDTNISEESHELGEITIGAKTVESTSTFANALSQFNVAYNDSNNVLRFSSEGFTRGNSSVYSNITQLLANEFLQLQVEPLEVLQADIYSSNISPNKLLKYSINSDGSYNYYTFLGGSFSAQSETMSGEWYKVSSSTSNIIEENQVKFNQAQDTNQLTSSLRNFKTESTSLLTSNAFCTLTTAVTSGSSITTLVVSNLLGAINDNQNITITFPDGSNGYILKSSADKYTNGTSISIDSWTPATDYPIGSLINLSLFDVPSMINERSSVAPTPAGSDTEMQFNDAGNMNGARYLTYDDSTGITTYKRLKTTAGEYVKPQPLYVKILPSDFIADDGGRPLAIDDSTSNRFLESHSSNVMFASVQIPFGYKATDVHIYGNGTSVMTVSEANINSRTVTSKGVGNIGTNLAITNVSVTTTNYILIELAQTSSEQVNGGIMTIALI